jgi:hypothetical protein
VREVGAGARLGSVEMLDQRRPVIPGHPLGAFEHIVAVQGRDRDRGEGIALFEQAAQGVAGGVERSGLEADQIHLVHHQHEIAHPQQPGDHHVAAALDGRPLAGVDEDDGEIGGRGAGRHVAGILLVAGRVGEQEATVGGGECQAGDVDRDALLALRLQPVGDEGEILDAGEPILRHRAAADQQPADQSRFAVVHRAAGEEAHDVAHQK